MKVMIKRFLMVFLAIAFLATPFSGSAQEETAPAQSGRLHLLASGLGGIRLGLATPTYSLSDQGLKGSVAQSITVVGAETTADPGQPQLPLVSALLGVPPGVQIDLQVLVDEVTSLDGPFNLTLAPGPLPLDQELTAGRMGVSSAPMSTLSELKGVYPPVAARIAGEAWMRDQRVVRVELYPFQFNPVNKNLIWHKNLQIFLRFRGQPTVSDLSVNGGQVNSNPFEASLEQSLLNYDTARQWRSRQASTSNIQSPGYPVQSLGPRYKIVVDRDGLYRVTYNDLKNAGMPVETVDPTQFRLSSQGQDIAFRWVDNDGNPNKFGSTDVLLFYGQKFRGDTLAARYAGEDASWPNFNGWQPHLDASMFEKYTDDNVYWLMVNGSGPRMVYQNASPGSAQTPLYYMDTVHAEQSHAWWTYHFTSEDTWFWERVDNGGVDITRNYTTTLTAVSPAPVSATVSAEVVAFSYNNSASPDHHTQFTINNRSTPLDDAQWDGRTKHDFSTQVPQSALVEGENQLHFTMLKTAAVPYDRIYFNWFEISYARLFQAENEQLLFSYNENNTPLKYQVTGFSSGSADVYDVTNPFQPVWLDPHQPPGNSVTFQDPTLHAGVAQYLVVAPGGRQSPRSISKYTPPQPDLFSTSNGADYIIVTHANFLSSAQRLADYRLAQGLRTKVINVADLYNEFNDGIFNPIAIKEFLKYAYANWQAPAPAYVLLIGSGHWNFKGYSGQSPTFYWNNPIYMPPNLAWVDPWQGEVDSANLLVNIVGNDILPDMSVGRLPVDTLDQANAAIDKFIAYEGAGWHPEQKTWQKHLLFIADNVPDDAGDFPQISDDVIASSVPPAYHVDKVYLNDYLCQPGTGPCPQVTAAITTTLNTNGALFVNYIGHGADQLWASESIFQTTGVAGDKDNPQKNNILYLQNGDRLPVVLSMTCLDGYWIHTLPDKISLAAELVRTANRGAVSTFSPTGLGVATGHDTLNKGFYNAVFRYGARQLGPATIASKLALYATGSNFDLIDTFTVFGDPALKIPVTSYLYLPMLEK